MASSTLERPHYFLVLGWHISTGALWVTVCVWASGVLSDLTHLQLEEPALLLHLLCNLGSGDLSPDHSVLLGVFPFLLLDLGTGNGSP